MDALKPRRLWFYPTPGWLVLGLLVVEGLLWLSARFQWFAFNSHKGSTVLIAAAAVGVATLVMLLWFIASLNFRWRFQFSIRSLLMLAVVVAILCSWLAVEMQAAKQQKETVEAIMELGGMISYDYQFDASGNSLRNPQPPGWVWLRNLLGDGFFERVDEVELTGPQVTDAILSQVGRLNGFLVLDIDGTQVSDEGLASLKGLDQLQELDICETMISNAGLEHLEGLDQLQDLELERTQVTDAGLEHLTRMRQLERLNLGETNVGDAGLRHLAATSQLQELFLRSTQVTDAGLKHLKELRQLQTLNLDGTEVTDAGLKYLKGLDQLKNLHLESTQVTDAGLEKLQGLKKLISLDLINTNVTDAGAAKLQRALPNCKISHGYLHIDYRPPMVPISELESLSLQGTKAKDAWLESFKGLTKLHKLDLSGTQVTDAGLKDLKALPQLQDLDLSGTKVTDEGVKKLQQALPDCRIRR